MIDRMKEEKEKKKEQIHYEMEKEKREEVKRHTKRQKRREDEEDRRRNVRKKRKTEEQLSTTVAKLMRSGDFNESDMHNLTSKIAAEKKEKEMRTDQRSNIETNKDSEVHTDEEECTVTVRIVNWIDDVENEERNMGEREVRERDEQTNRELKN